MKDFQAVRSEPSKLFLRSMLILVKPSLSSETHVKKNTTWFIEVKGLNIAKPSE